MTYSEKIDNKLKQIVEILKPEDFVSKQLVWDIHNLVKELEK